MSRDRFTAAARACTFALFSATACGEARPVTVIPAPSDAPLAHDARHGFTCKSVVALSGAEKPRDPASAAVVSVEVEGAANPAAVCSVLRTAPGGAIDKESIERDVREIWASGLVDDVEVARDTVPGGVTIVFMIKPRPTFASTRLDGARGITAVDESMLPAAPGRIDPFLVHKTIVSLRDELHLDGFRHAEIAAVPERRGSAIELVFRVEAGAQTRIGKIVFDGVKTIKESDALGVMGSQPGTAASEQRLALDALRIQSFYYDHGMILARVDDPVMRDARDPNVADLTITVHEGAVYRIGLVHVTGDLLDQENEYLRRFWSSKKGDVFNRTLVAADIDRIKAFHTQRGFEVSVTPETELHPDKNTVDITLRIGR